MTFHDRGELCNPVLGLVSHVPDQSEASAGTKDAMHLLESAASVEPVPRLAGGDRIDAGRPERKLLGGGRDGLDPKLVNQLAAHTLDGLDGNHSGPGRKQSPSELAGPGGDIDHQSTRREPEP